MKRLLLAALFVPFALIAKTANADVINMIDQNFQLQNFNRAIDNLVDRDEPTRPVAAQKEIAVTSLKFTSSAARTRANLAAFANKTRKTDPQTAAQMDAMFASTDIIGQIGEGISPYGLSTSNVADAYAVYWINAWEASRGIVGAQETRQRAQAVKAQATRGLSSLPELVSATDAQKQELAEALMVQAAMISSHMEAAASDQAQLRTVAEAVAKGAKAAGLDLSTMDLTLIGFVPLR